MRSYVALIGLAVLMAFVAGGTLLLMRTGQRTVSDQDILAITKLKTAFQHRVGPLSIINISSYYHTNHHYKLVSPIYSLPDFDQADPSFYAHTGDCFKGVHELEGLFGHRKVVIWEEFRCGLRAYLPADFFDEPPFMHPSGVSFMYLAYLTGKPQFREMNWIIDKLPLFHVHELKNIPELKGRLRGIFFILSELTDEELESVASSQGSVLTSKYLLARLIYEHAPTLLEYRVYDRADLDQFLTDTDYTLGKYNPKRPCFYRDEELCWSPNSKKVLERINLFQICIFIGCIFLMGLALMGLRHRLRDDRSEEESKRLALQTLTHELRTPITSLVLEIENISREIELLPPELQDSFFRMSSEIHRLHRLTESSRQYLNVGQKRGQFKLHPVLIPSINEFLMDVARPYLEKELTVKLLEQDRSFILDSYWPGIIVKNLLENAFLHGLPPVTMTCDLSAGKLRITVVDQGQGVDLNSLHIGQEFQKGIKSSGTGLGLSIVKRAILVMGGEFKYSPAPTTFSVTLKELKLPT